MSSGEHYIFPDDVTSVEVGEMTGDSPAVFQLTRAGSLLLAQRKKPILLEFCVLNSQTRLRLHATKIISGKSGTLRYELEGYLQDQSGDRQQVRGTYSALGLSGTLEKIS